jgi:molybdate transport system permease protein
MVSLLRDSGVSSALRLSLECASAATALSLVFGVPLAWVFARVRIRAMRVLRTVVLLPLVLPPVVGGLALLISLGRTGVVGRYLNMWFGLQLPFTTPAVVLSETFVSMPFLVITVEGALRSSDRDLEEAAASLGASRLTVFRRVTLPCWARALGEFGATITFAGSFPGTTQVMPSAVYAALDVNFDAAIALSLVLLLVAAVVLGSLRDHWLPRSAAT